MTILYDFISMQGSHNGGEEYARYILNQLTDRKGVNIIGLYDSTKNFLDDDESTFNSKYKMLDIKDNLIADIIHNENVDVFFIAIGQRYLYYDLTSIECKSIVVIHDLGTIEAETNQLRYFTNGPLTMKTYVKGIIHKILNKIRNNKPKHDNYQDHYSLMNFISQENTTLITVSNYTKNSINFYFPQLTRKEIKVLYPRIFESHDYGKQKIENRQLQDLIDKKQKYILMLNAHRSDKNYVIIKRVAKKMQLLMPDLHFVVTGITKTSSQNIHGVGRLSESDLQYAYKNAWALVYPSLQEGFGLPPIQSIKYGVPVLSSNVCSMPEILGQSAVYFSPFYASDLYRAICSLKDNYGEYESKAHERYLEINAKIISDSDILIDVIISSAEV